MTTKLTKLKKADDFKFESYLTTYHEKIYRDNIAKMVNHLEKNHPIKLLLNKQEKINQTISVLESIKDKFQNCGQFECATVEQWQLLDRLIKNLKSIDRHFHHEEELLFPELVEHGFVSEVRQIKIEHREAHQLIDRLISEYRNGIKDNYAEMSKAVNSIGIDLAKKIRLLHHRESHILFPRLLRVVSGKNSWKHLHEIANTLQLQLV